MTRSAEIYALLPATAFEVACELEIPSKLVLAQLCSMLNNKRKNRVIVVGRKREGTRGMHCANFWEGKVNNEPWYIPPEDYRALLDDVARLRDVAMDAIAQWRRAVDGK